ncbi:hypothetical protein UlMin_028410 [Ulmus minor]
MICNSFISFGNLIQFCVLCCNRRTMPGSESNEDDLILLVFLMDSFVRKICRRSRIPKHMSAFSGHERMSVLISRHEGLLLEQMRMNKDYFTRLCTLLTDCVGVIDGTHIEYVVPSKVDSVYRNRKGFTSQNVMAMVDFEMKFTYLVAGWEGSAHDARILNVAMTNPKYRFPHAPPGKYYLVDVGYKNKPGFLAHFCGQNYHLHDLMREDGDRRKKMFNYRHASLYNVIERTFGV